ncbi:MAG: aspartate aminotransferase family protein [Natronospirillum sp.]|uniref:aspartate aminotransferase family protein n=1 Tax=Natronospirillum sp. TaxID=2812955 RepID=UPI0025DBC59A|nr:aspartate aminotransferase family protein [Natronospirillum sp.]MCH8552709.1 aspartate aminotransferase family protein [Natronospirillum sp.]
MTQQHPDRSVFDQVMTPNYAPLDVIPVRGRGSRLWDQEGREYVDLAGGIAVNSLGHCHPELVAELKAQADELWHLSNVYTNEPALNLAQKLCDLTFADKVYFCNSGAEANEAALKLARRKAWNEVGEEKHEIISTRGSFHGRTLFTVTVGGQEKYTEGFRPAPGGITHIPYNDIAALEAAISDKTCAVMLEPVQGEGGVRPAEKAYLEAARRLCDKHNALLIFDEVQTGVGRSGALYAYMHYGVTPDVLTTAKSLGGGFPVGAMLATDEAAKALVVGTHGSTYGGNPLACRVASRVLDVVTRDEVKANVEARTAQLREGLQRINEEHRVFQDVRGLGLLVGAELVDEWHGKAKLFLQAALREGLMILVAGPNVLRMAPSLLVTEADIALALEQLERAVAQVKSETAAA